MTPHPTPHPRHETDPTAALDRFQANRHRGVTAGQFLRQLEGMVAFFRQHHAEIDRNARAERDGSAWPGHGDGTSRGSDVARPTEQAAMSPARQDVHVFDGLLADVTPRLPEIVRAADRLRHIEPKDAPLPGAGACQACERWVTGGEHDRIRAGLCDACRKWTDRHRGAERCTRHEAILARRAWLADQATERGLDSGRSVTELDVEAHT